eukprot:Amastigsp_a176135_37.p1 type:complete len:790 gc:universal Amastigsp_a176135_37:2413-44(-)
MASIASVAERLQQEMRTVAPKEVPAMPSDLQVVGVESIPATTGAPLSSDTLVEMTPLQKRLALSRSQRQASLDAVLDELAASGADADVFEYLFFTVLDTMEMLATLRRDPSRNSTLGELPMVERAVTACLDILSASGTLMRTAARANVDSLHGDVARFAATIKDLLAFGKSMANAEPDVRPEIMRHLKRLRDASTLVVQAVPKAVSERVVVELERVLRALVKVCADLVRALPTLAPVESAETRQKREASNFVASMLRRMAVEYFSPGEYVIRKGEKGTQMYFLTSGTVAIELKTGSDVQLHEGSFFGEIALFFSKRRTASVRAVTQVDVAVLTKDAVDEILTQFPLLYEEFKRMGEVRMKDKKDKKKPTGTLGRDGKLVEPEPADTSVPQWFSDVQKRVATMRAKPQLKIYTPQRALVLDGMFKSSDAEFLSRLLEVPDEIIGILAAVCTREELDTLVAPLLRVFDSARSLVSLVDFVVRFEIERTPLDMAASLFRGSSLGPKVLGGFLLDVSEDYTAAVLRPGFEILVAHPELTQLVENDALDETTFQSLLSLLLRALNTFADTIFRNVALVPPIVRITAHMLMVSAEARFGQFESIIGGLLFLRLLCPSLLNSPERFGYDRTSAGSQKLLVTVSKALQNLSNRTAFPMVHRYSAALNEFIRSRDVDRTYFMSDVVDLECSSISFATCHQVFKASRANELPLEVGSRVEAVKETSSKDWLWGKRGELTGFLPRNHVTVTVKRVYAGADVEHLPQRMRAESVGPDVATLRAMTAAKEAAIYGWVQTELK